jgi:lipopolysaccharide/colanic/teichoic acid biosynthesis glycosyltransferase
LSVEVDPISIADLHARTVHVRLGTFASPIAADVSAETAEQIEALALGPAEPSRMAVVGIAGWSRSATTGEAAGHGDLTWGPIHGPGVVDRHAGEDQGTVEVARWGDASAPAGADTIVISAVAHADARSAPHAAALRRACADVVRVATKGQTIILASASHVGCTRDLLITPLRRRGFEIGRDINVAFCPVGGTQAGRTAARPAVVGGATPGCAGTVAGLVGQLGTVRIVDTPEEAEASVLAALPRSRAGAAVKRAVDILLAAIGLLLLVPVFVPVALVILLDSGGPIHFTQTRIGQNGRHFRMLKFRTMVNGAEARLGEVLQLNQIRGPAFQIEDDPRLTRIGRFLRRTSIDELPQLWNVLRGEMSLVGPRPAPPVEVEAYEPWHRARLTARPGITGLAQVRARSYRDFDEKATLDLEYICHWSLWLDFVILLRSVPVVLGLTGR